jgi:multiple sugar transport system substrate-binding protein
VPAVRLAWLLGLAVLAGCADRPREAAEITLVFKHAHILGQGNPIPQLVAEFEAGHPGVRVRAESLPWNTDEQRQFFVINLESGRPGFDVMMLDVIWVPEFARAGWLLDLTPHLQPGELGAFFPSAADAATFAGRAWALPWNMNVGLLYYRKDLLARHGLAPPLTYAELVAQAEQIRAAERGGRLDGFLWQGKQYEGLVVNVIEQLRASGTELLGPDGALFPDPRRAEQALAFMRSLIDRGVSPGWTTAADEELTRRAFGKGEAVFLRNWPYALDLLEAPGSPVRGRVGIAPLPRHPGGLLGAGSTGGAHLAIHRGTRHPDLALDLVRALTSETAQRRMVTGAALYPTRVALYQAPDLVRSLPALPAIATLTLAGHPRPVTPYYLTISTLLQPELSAALVRVKTPARAVADARRAVEFVLRDAAAAAGRPRP